MAKSNDNVPFLDLVTPHEELEEELVAVFREAIRSARFAGGPLVEGFEADFAAFCDASHGIGVSSGTDALRFALIAAGVEPGDSVLTVPSTFVATTEAITQAGATPEFVDIEERTSNLDVEKLRLLLDAETKTDPKTGRPVSQRTGRSISGIVPVHLYGQMADMDPILELAEQHNLVVVEDACQAHGAEYYSNREGAWRRAGSMGHAAAFSFYPGKNLGACGEAGAVTTNCESLARKVAMLRDHGQSRKYVHQIEGYNGRLDAIQAGILRVKLRSLRDWTESRRRLAARYSELLRPIEQIRAPAASSTDRSVYHLYVIHTRDRDALQQELSEAGIGTGLHYPIPLHLQEAYADLGYCSGDFPVAEKAARELLSLPMYPQLTLEQVDRVVDAIGNHFHSASETPSFSQI